MTFAFFNGVIFWLLVDVGISLSAGAVEMVGLLQSGQTACGFLVN
jgi:hypothetical protein